MMTRLKQEDAPVSVGPRPRPHGRMAFPVVLALLLAATCPSAPAAPWPSLTGDARAVGIGGAYAALARGPLAPLWNPAGIITAPGVQVALSSALLSSGDGSLLVGAAIVAAGGPAVAWNLIEDGSGRAIQGTFALALREEVTVGATAMYDVAAPAGFALGVGLLVAGEAWSLGASLLGLGAGPFGPPRTPQLLLGFSLRTVPAITIGIDLHLFSTGGEIALGGVANLWAVGLRWGLAMGVHGGLERAGLGCDLALMGQELNIALLVRGADLSLTIVVGLEARIPAWW